MKPRLRLVVDNSLRRPPSPNLSPASRLTEADADYVVNRALHLLRNLPASHAEKERLVREHLANDEG